MLRIVLIRPGATAFDQQGRIKGSLDMPLSAAGVAQVEQTTRELANLDIDGIYSAPCESARVTAERLASGRGVRIKVLECFRNIDHGLWHGKLIDEVRRQQPRLYRQGQETPGQICPPGGESIQQAEQRVVKALRKLVHRSRGGIVALVIPDPLASVVRSLLSGDQLRDLWKAETDAGSWELIEPMVDPTPVPC